MTLGPITWSISVTEPSYSGVRPKGVTILQFLRLKRGWTQTALSKQSGIPTPTISFIESGRLNPTDDELSALARALGVPAETLLRIVEPDLSVER